jgi:PKD repeat protein
MTTSRPFEATESWGFVSFPHVATPPDLATLQVTPDFATAPGDYTFTISGASAAGEAATARAVLTVEPFGLTPTAEFFFFIDCDELTYRFNDQSRGSGRETQAEIVSWQWDFGDGSTSDEEFPSTGTRRRATTP